MGKKGPNTTDVAHRAGTSQSAVSMILNHPEDTHFSAETIRKVLDAAEALGYKKRARRAATGASFQRDTILILCPVISNPYYASLLQAAEQAAAAHGYATIVCSTYRDIRREQELLLSFRDSNIRGILFTFIPGSCNLLEDISRTIPVVVIGDRNTTINTDTVEIDSILSGKLVAEHLIKLGHRHIGFISTTLDSRNAVRMNRLDGLRQVISQLGEDGGITVSTEEVSPADDLGNPSIEHQVGYRLAKELLADRKITAMVAVNDMVAYGVMDAVLEEGHAIPKDYSICGFDNIFPSKLPFVALTTVEHCIMEKGREAMNILHERIHSGQMYSESIKRVEYRPRLIVRKTTGKARQT